MCGQPIRVLIVDDHAVVREGLRMFLLEEEGFTVVGEAANGRDAVQAAARLHPDVALMDLVMPEMDGIEATRQLRRVCPACSVLVLSSFADDGKVREAIQAGALGYLLKDMLRADLVRALRDAVAGVPTLHPEVQRSLMQRVATPPAPSALDLLTPRELDVLRCIARGRSNKEIAADLRLTEGTVKGYVSAVLAKLDVADRTQAALLAVRQGVG